MGGNTGEKRERDRGREMRDCCHCVLPNLVNGFEGTGRQTNVVLWDGWHIFSSRLDSLQAAGGIKFSSNMRIAGGSHQFGLNLKLKTQIFGSI